MSCEERLSLRHGAIDSHVLSPIPPAAVRGGRRGESMRVVDWPLAVRFATAGVTSFDVTCQIAVHSGGDFAAVLLYAAPAWMAVIARFVCRERMTPLKIAALCRL